VAYVQLNGLPLSSSAIGALTPTELNAADKAFIKAVPAGAWDFLKGFPLIPQSLKDSLVAKPVTTMLGMVSANRNLWIKIVNRAAILQGRYNKAWTFPSVPKPTRFVKMRATAYTQDLSILKMWLALSWADPLSCIRAVVIEEFKVASGSVNWLVGQIAQAIGLKQPSVKGLGEPLSAGGAALIGTGVTAAAGIAKTAITVAGVVTATITVAVLDKAFPDANTVLETQARTEEAKAGGGRRGGVPEDWQEAAKRGRGGSDIVQPRKGGGYVQPTRTDYSPGGGSGTQSAEEEGGMPSWALPAGIGAIGLVFLLMRKKRA